jgi:N-methylhydantoinase A
MGRLAVDIGGTFTDLVFFDEAGAALTSTKVLTTPDGLERGVMAAVAQSGIVPTAVDYFIHGGTTVVNAITERTGAKTALVNTAGFRDVLELGRANRPDMFNIRYRKPAPFVPRRYCFEVRGRLDPIGQEIEPLELADLDPIVEACLAAEIEAVAIMLVNSYAEPAHEVACANYLRERLPSVAVTASHEVSREWREYERASTIVLNAYVQPIVRRYLDSLEGALVDLGIGQPHMAVQSNGGTTTFAWAKAHPITLLESGPAAGVSGAALVGALCGHDDLIYLDVGGTTAKCSTIEGGEPRVTTEHAHGASHREPGFPIRVPIVDIVEIGAGGGSIAWFDEADALQVGPKSAGADPGPACYGRGGTAPTVTDAKLIAGALNPAYFAAGQIDLDEDKARAALAPIAEGLHCSVEDAANAIVRLVEANMIDALKLVSIERGHDPRDFAMVVGGGGGAMHAAALGRELGVKEIVIPRYPGLFSAWGMLASRPRQDFIRTAPQIACMTTPEEIRAIRDALRRDAERYFADAGFAAADLSHALQIDLRYEGQEHPVTVRDIDADEATVDDIVAAFHVAHARTYSYRLDDTPVEFVTFRLTALVDVARPEFQPISADGRSAERALKGMRAVVFGEDGRHEATIYERDALPPEFTAAGPLVIEEPSSTTLVHPGQRLRIDTHGFMRISDA